MKSTRPIASSYVCPFICNVDDFSKQAKKHSFISNSRNDGPWTPQLGIFEFNKSVRLAYRDLGLEIHICICIYVSTTSSFGWSVKKRTIMLAGYGGFGLYYWLKERQRSILPKTRYLHGDWRGHRSWAYVYKGEFLCGDYYLVLRSDDRDPRERDWSATARDFPELFAKK